MTTQQMTFGFHPTTASAAQPGALARVKRSYPSIAPATADANNDRAFLRKRSSITELEAWVRRAAIARTYKGKARLERGVKTRLELESGVQAPERVAELLVELGFAPRFTYDKRRTTWRFADAARPVVAVDETPLGLFAELEGEEKAVRRLAEELGIPEEAFIPESYVALWMKAREKDPTLPPDMVFRAGEGGAGGASPEAGSAPGGHAPPAR